ncbi:MAG TPA: patatin-like phospholipase family protein [Galbitalea sp.]|jgi:NTE family protein|nr:patatin-like phospholipase family protein [Galbitalea sp.]
MNTHSSSPASGSTQRALVLGGGGSAGNAWLIGIIAGLFDTGLDVTNADLIIGTSAGATAAAQITSATRPGELFASILAAVPPARTHQASAAPQPSTISHLDQLSAIIASARDAPDMRRRLGAATLEGDKDPAGSAKWRATVAGRLPGLTWPDRRVLITAIDANSGEGVVLDRESGVDLIDAVAASTSNGFGAPPFVIGDRRLLDGGYRRNENADLASGYERVLVLSPLGGRTLHPLEWGMQLAAQVNELRAGGSRVETVLPDSDSLAVFGGNMMDPSTRLPAARAGHSQGAALAGDLAEFWG